MIGYWLLVVRCLLVVVGIEKLVYRNQFANILLTALPTMRFSNICH